MIVYNLRMIGLFLLLMVVSAPVSKALGENPSGHVERLVSLLQSRYEDTSDITARFVQETFAVGVSDGLKAEGKVYFKRPHQMRWEYSLPEPQIIVTTGQKVYVYEKEANQVMILPRDQLLSSEISRAFFFGKGDLRRFFNVDVPEDDRPDKRWVLKLTPKDPGVQVRTIWLTVDPDFHLVKEMWLKDQLGARTHLVFSNVKVNKGLSDTLFRFVPPPGVEIYHGDDIQDRK